MLSKFLLNEINYYSLEKQSKYYNYIWKENNYSATSGTLRKTYFYTEGLVVKILKGRERVP